MRALFSKPPRAVPPHPPRTPLNGPYIAPPLPPRAFPASAPVGPGPIRPLPPRGTSLHGRELWSAMLDRYEFERHELVLLREFVRCADDLDRLAGAISRHGVVTARGDLNPAVEEARQLRIALAALGGALRLPAEDQHEAPTPMRQPQRYAAVRPIDSAAPRTEAKPRAVTHGRHSAGNQSPSKAATLSVAELCARANYRAPTSQRVV